MFDTLVKKILGSQSDRDYKKSLPTVELVNQLADQMNSLSDNELQLKTAEFRQQLRDRVQKQNSRISEIEAELANDLEPEIRDRSKWAAHRSGHGCGAPNERYGTLHTG